jgi:polyisoprenoid-binding protein YceI
MVMQRYDENDAEAWVFTEREGALAAVGHDLRIAVEEFSIEIDEEAGRVEAEFSADSLRVAGSGREDDDGYDEMKKRDRKKIEKNIRREVLRSARHPKIHFEADEIGGDTITGELTLRGTTREISCEIRHAEGRTVARAVIHQPDFDIKPYEALLGTLRLAEDVVVRVELPEEL